MRKAINGLSIMVEQHMSKDPFSGDLFVFCNRRRNIIKILYWDRNGFCLWHKRLAEHQIKWPRSAEEVDYVSAKIRVIPHIRYKYACKSCEGIDSDGPTVKIAPPPVQLIPKIIASEGLIAHLIVSKFADGLPLYRQQKIFSRLSIDLSRATMANWVVKAALQCRPLMDLLQKEIRSGPLINIDETPYQVLNEPGRCNTTKSYMWVFKGGREDRPALLCQYHRTRSGKAALKFLGDYQGYVQSDAFFGYDRLSEKKGISHLGCWAHARRNFVHVIKAKKKNRSKRVHPKSLADEALEFIGRLYQMDT